MEEEAAASEEEMEEMEEEEMEEEEEGEEDEDEADDEEEANDEEDEEEDEEGDFEDDVLPVVPLGARDTLLSGWVNKAFEVHVLVDYFIHNRLRDIRAASDMKELDSLMAKTISNEAIRRLLRRGGAVRCVASSYHQIRAFIFLHLCKLIHDAFIYAEHEGTVCITGFHIECAVKLQRGRRLYSFSSPAIYTVPDPDAHLSKAKVLVAKHVNPLMEDITIGRLQVPGTLITAGALFEVRFWQHEHGLLIRCQPFKKLVQQIGLGFVSDSGLNQEDASKSMVFQQMAITALQTEVENYAIGLIEDTLLAALHGPRCNLMFDKDFALAFRIRGERP